VLGANGCDLDWPPPLARGGVGGAAPADGGAGAGGTAGAPNDCAACATLGARIHDQKPAAVHPVAAGQDLQAALDAALPGDELVLEAGATFGPLEVRSSGADGAMITVRTAAADALPGPCTRLRDEDVAVLPKIVGQGGEPALFAADGVHHVRFVGIELTVDPDDGSGLPRAVVVIGRGDESDEAALPSFLELDRAYIHANADGRPEGVAANGGDTTIKNSLVTGFHDGHTRGVVIYNGTGPLRLLNDRIESFDRMLVVGSDNWTPKIAVPSQIELRYSRLTRPPSWKQPEPAHNYLTGWLLLANAAHVTVDGNLFDQNWEWSAIELDATNVNVPQVVDDVRFENNVFHATPGNQLLRIASSASPEKITGVRFSNNVADPVSWTFGLWGGATDLRIVHNTMLVSGDRMIYAEGVSAGLVFADNLTGYGQYGVMCGGPSFNDCAPTVFPGATFTGNVIWGAPLGAASDYPPGNTFAGSEPNFVDPAAGDYTLPVGSPYVGKASDGKNPGIDVAALSAAAACRSP